MAGINKIGFRVTGRLDVSKVESAYTTKSKKAMVLATTFWKARTVKAAPVAKGQTKQRIQQFVGLEKGLVVGGLTFGTLYSKYLIFGADHGILKKVKNWRIGHSPIKTWPAKEGKKAIRTRDSKGRFVKGKGGKKAGGNKNAVLPLALPFAMEALAVLKQNMK